MFQMLTSAKKVRIAPSTRIVKTMTDLTTAHATVDIAVMESLAMVCIRGRVNITR